MARQNCPISLENPIFEATFTHGPLPRAAPAGQESGPLG
jgi:hypothetical protein